MKPAQSNKMDVKTAFSSLAFGLILAVAGGCSRGTPPKSAEAVPVQVAIAVQTNMPVQIDPPPVGHVVALSTVTVHPQIQGMISEIHFKEGQEVNRGDPLFTIDSRPAQAALNQAQANLERDSGQLEYARANYVRDQKLFDSKIVSQNQMDTDRASLDTATGTVAADKAAITNAVLNLGYCDIRSPIDGRTGELKAFVGNVVKAPDDALLTINQVRPIYVQFGVLEQYLPEIRQAMRDRNVPVTVSFEGMAGPPPQGVLTFVNNSVDATTGLIQLKAKFANTNDALWPGQFVTVNLKLSELTNAVVVPSEAVQTGQNGEFVYVVKPDETVDERPVTIGATYGGNTVVQTGLQAGETVVTDGQLRLEPGIKVNAKSFAGADHSTNAPENVQ